MAGGDPWRATAFVAALAALLLGACGNATHEVDVELYHCGVLPLKVDGKTWEVPQPPPFDGTNAPPTFTGRGTATIEADDKLIYVDDGGARVRFRPAEDVPAPPPCA
jgi:hypothetical protein